jgi:hypothetical protein
MFGGAFEDGVRKLEGRRQPGTLRHRWAVTQLI